LRVTKRVFSAKFRSWQPGLINNFARLDRTIKEQVKGCGWGTGFQCSNYGINFRKIEKLGCGVLKGVFLKHLNVFGKVIYLNFQLSTEQIDVESK